MNADVKTQTTPTHFGLLVSHRNTILAVMKQRQRSSSDGRDLLRAKTWSRPWQVSAQGRACLTPKAQVAVKRKLQRYESSIISSVRIHSVIIRSGSIANKPFLQQKKFSQERQPSVCNFKTTIDTSLRFPGKKLKISLQKLYPKSTNTNLQIHAE